MSGDVRTTQQALDLMATSLTSWRTEMTGWLAQADAQVNAATAKADHDVQRRLATVRAMEQRIQAGERGTEMALQHAAETLRVAQGCQVTVRRAAELLRAARRRADTVLSGAVPAAVASLRAMSMDVDRYANAQSSTPGSGLGGGAGRGSSDSAGLSDALAKEGLQLLDVELASFEDNPLLDEGKGGAKSADYRWAVEAWATVIAPAMAAGASRADLEARDAARGAAPFRSLAIAYDLFVKDPILVSRGEGGSWSVTGGRHRLDAAKKAGLTHLPGKVLG